MSAPTGICVVVGAGPCLGQAVARRFAKAGYRLALIARKQQTLEGFIAEMETAGVEATAATANVLVAQPVSTEAVPSSPPKPSSTGTDTGK